MELITTVDELTKYVAVIATSEIESIRPYIRMSQRNYLLPVLGSDFIESLTDTYTTANQDTTAITDEKTRTAIELAQEVLANLSIMHALPVLSVNIGANGISVVKNEQVAPASQWRTTQVLESLAEVGFKAVDALLSFLDKEHTTFTIWSQDPVYSLYKQYFIRSANAFSTFYNIRESRFLFHTISYCMRRVETFEIKGAIGTALFTALKEQDQANTIAGDMAELLNEYLKPAIALFTIAKALQERLISISAGNVALKFSGNNQENTEESRPPLLTELNQTIASIKTDARTFMDQAQEFIKSKPESFETYAPQTASKRRMNAKNGADRDLFIF